MSNTMQLKYLFQVVYRSGEVYLQNKEDTSITEPTTRSCYFDVKQDEVVSFTLSNREHTYTVNLEDGHFEVDGVSFLMHTDPELKDYRLIYYRQHTHSFNQNDEELAHEIVYCLGWQTLDKNEKNVQRIMTIN